MDRSTVPHDHVQDMSPFMQLPAEIRLLIYRYLVPNGIVYTTASGRRMSRHLYLQLTKTRFYGKLLRVNRQIYQELHQEWYSHAEFRVELSHGVLYFLDDIKIDRFVSLPTSLLSVRKMSMRLGFEDASDISISNLQQASFILHSYCDQLLSRTPESRLQYLHLHFTIQPVMIMHGPGYDNKMVLLEALKSYLDPLRRLVGLVGECTAKASLTTDDGTALTLRESEILTPMEIPDYQNVNSFLEEGLGVKVAM